MGLSVLAALKVVEYEIHTGDDGLPIVLTYDEELQTWVIRERHPSGAYLCYNPHSETHPWHWQQWDLREALRFTAPDKAVPVWLRYCAWEAGQSDPTVDELIDCENRVVSPYLLQPAHTSVCSTCRRSVDLLCRRDGAMDVAFYICWACRQISHVGVGPVVVEPD